MKKEIIYTEQQQNFINKLEEAEKHYDASCNEIKEFYKAISKDLTTKLYWAQTAKEDIQKICNHIYNLFGYVDTKILSKEIYLYFDIINLYKDDLFNHNDILIKFNNLNYYQRLVLAHDIAKKFKYTQKLEEDKQKIPLDFTYEILSRSDALTLLKIERFIDNLAFFSREIEDSEFEKMFKIEIIRFFDRDQVRKEYSEYLEEFSPLEPPVDIKKAFNDVKFLDWFIKKHKTKEIEDILRNKELFIKCAKKQIELKYAPKK